MILGFYDFTVIAGKARKSINQKILTKYSENLMLAVDMCKQMPITYNIMNVPFSKEPGANQLLNGSPFERFAIWLRCRRYF